MRDLPDTWNIQCRGGLVMDKRKVIDAYRRGFLTPQECAQVLGVERGQLNGLLDLPADSLRIIAASANNRPASS